MVHGGVEVMTAKNKEDGTERLNTVNHHEVTFEGILEKIGSRGKFQIRLNLIYVGLSVLVCSVPSQMFVISMMVPDHWCHVPGRASANVSIEEWKSITIPRENGTYSKCLMFTSLNQTNETIPCQYGWDYDETWFSSTLPSQENWVCGKKMVVSHTMATVQGLSVIVGLALCYVGDRFGRRIQYFVSLILIASCRSLSVPATAIYSLFIVLSVIGTAADSSTTEATVSIGLELSDVMFRSTVNFMFSLMHSVGSILSPLTAWAAGDWRTFTLVSSLPCFLLVSCQSFLPESPRWLLNKGHTKKAFRVVSRIAETNEKPIPDDTLAMLNTITKRRSPKMGVLSLVTNRSLFRNTLILIFGRCVCILTTSCIRFNVGNLGGNPFLAFIAQGVVDAPAHLAAHFLGNKFGRRFTEALSLLTATFVSIVIIFAITVSGQTWVVACGVTLLKFFCVMSLFTNVLQSMEIHPTCIRQIGSAVEWAFVAAVIGIAPYIVHLGTAVDSRCLYGVLGALLASAAVITSFLPESLNEKLPETLEDATNYGSSQKYWSLPSSTKS
ncbi:solute carrier family 22 member 7-like [Schistocerca serialis cubense]|uniref:solute carrier family 22 member 7-like n=1 Tax=Schistocerca serialis cubense TaxID=2023355 RepID=UPI00214EA70C|nr:solute carrier family 22 member 7-like [Schistocerca serialis cubense]